MVGIDVSKWQATVPSPPPGVASWDFVFCRATHSDGTPSVDGKFSQHFADALQHGKLRGAYHFADPPQSSAVAQAAFFVATCLSNGFVPGRDLWALDIESGGGKMQGALDNVQWVADFMKAAGVVLGGRAFLYTGWPWAESMFGIYAEVTLRKYNWWLPAYGPNDGKEHAYNAPDVPVLHQYTSLGGAGGSSLDVNSITDAGAWQRIVGAALPTHPAPAPMPAKPPVVSTVNAEDANVIADISGIHLDVNGDGAVDLPNVPFQNVASALVIGGNDPLDPKSKRYDKRPSATAINVAGHARFVLIGGVPSGTYTLRVSHV